MIYLTYKSCWKIHWRRDRLPTPVFLGFPCGSVGKESACSAGGRPGFDAWIGKILWKKESLPTPVFWPGEFHGLYSSWGHKESDTHWVTFTLTYNKMIKKYSFPMYLNIAFFHIYIFSFVSPPIFEKAM